MFQLKPPSTWSPYWVSISAYCNFSQVHFDAPILIISFLASSIQSLGRQKFSSLQQHSFSYLETIFESMLNLLICNHVHGNQFQCDKSMGAFSDELCDKLVLLVFEIRSGVHFLANKSRSASKQNIGSFRKSISQHRVAPARILSVSPFRRTTRTQGCGWCKKAFPMP